MAVCKERRKISKNFCLHCMLFIEQGLKWNEQFQCKVAGDESAHSALPAVGVSRRHCASSSGYSGWAEQFQFWDITESSKGRGEYIRGLCQIYSPPLLGGPPKTRNSEFRWQFSFIPRPTDTYSGYTNNVSFQKVLEQKFKIKDKRHSQCSVCVWQLSLCYAEQSLML